MGRNCWEGCINRELTTGRTLRTLLRNETRAAHDALDAALDPADLLTALGYGQFLECQYRARAGIETWFAQHKPTLGAGLSNPPAVTALLLADLRALGGTAGLHPLPFTPPADVDALAMAWVIAGSSLGNRVILSRLANCSHPTAFLQSPALQTYWRSLLPLLERPVVDSDASIASAHAVFAHFATAMAMDSQRRAA